MADALLARIRATADRWRRCPTCGGWWSRRVLEPCWTCPGCASPFRMSARRRIALLVDAGTFVEHDATLRPGDPLRFTDRVPYPTRYEQARARTGLSEAAVLGTAGIGGTRVALVVLDFDFMGGSMGVVVGEKVARGAEIASAERIPLLTVSASGGGRMQEGVLALQQGAKTAAAIRSLRDAGIPYISVLTDPVLGGVHVSFSSAGDVVIAEDGARAGFAGRRVIEQTSGQQLPPEFQSASFLLRHGHVDSVATRPELPRVLRRLVSYAGTRVAPPTVEPAPAPAMPPCDEDIDPWEAVRRVRATHRPRLRHYLDAMFTDVFELHGDRRSGEDPVVFGGFARLHGEAVVVIGHDRITCGPPEGRNNGMTRPSGYRKATRLMVLAARWGLPVVTLVDTPGAHPGAGSERANQSEAIAETMITVAGLATPVVCAVIGEGGSGGALALSIGDRLLMQQNATYSIISPEGCAAILFSDSAKAPDAARALGLRAVDLRRHGVVDEVVAEPPGGAHTDPARAADLLRHALRRHLDELRARPVRTIVAARARRLRALGRDWCLPGDDVTGPVDREGDRRELVR
ncbi:acetyl-CoA carboxylase carboxyl transferase subunit beta [Saccharothrix tamanrassetensis]|uniref:Acetyl-coenzyme A carboxylase carboxyl transferase subunit beta n=1 Tax=Saccharothrix tamanrassetensis TaxID=1051531 RepID=A0A841CMU6_9PSEU|nr:acetyl-CoA carboxylase carboxyltransferase subunit alpha/beta [Saccharothrix tamanrassetensis]MBB5959792.1 acetyl-CoA carboxylase carboxyl transferase subunit beta [Saccharothrix tamanrassetensis]